MQTVETNSFRNEDGWQSKTTIDLENHRVLVIHTRKMRIGPGLRTTATVLIKGPDGSMRHAIGFGTPSGDFSETVVFSCPKRVTESVVTTQHLTALEQLPRLLIAIEAHYSKGKSASETVVAALATPA